MGFLTDSGLVKRPEQLNPVYTTTLAPAQAPPSLFLPQPPKFPHLHSWLAPCPSHTQEPQGSFC